MCRAQVGPDIQSIIQGAALCEFDLMFFFTDLAIIDCILMDNETLRLDFAGVD